MNKIVKSDAEWRAQLSDEEYHVTRRHATERAWTGRYASNKDPGVYHCICCDAPLFDSETKFESGTGWPSFWQPIADEAVGTRIVAKALEKAGGLPAGAPSRSAASSAT